MTGFMVGLSALSGPRRTPSSVWLPGVALGSVVHGRGMSNRTFVFAASYVLTGP